MYMSSKDSNSQSRTRESLQRKCLQRRTGGPTYKYAISVVLITIVCSQTFMLALATEGSPSPNGSVPINNVAVDESSSSRTASRRNRLTSNSSVTFITHELFGDGYQFCSFHGACRLGDGTVLLPSWMEAHSSRLKACGLESIRFDILTADGTPTVKGTSSITMQHEFEERDVVGNVAPPGELSLLAEYLTPSLIMMDMLRRPSAYENITKRICVTETGASCMLKGNRDSFISFNPMIFIDSRVSHTKDFLWPKSLLRLVRNSLEGDLEIADLKDKYGWKIRSQALCFRSITSTSVKTSDIPETAFVPDNLFFSVNGLTREPADVSRQNGSRCNVKVLILNRYGKRFLEGGDLLHSVISSYGRELSKLEPQILVEAEEVFFEHSSFHEQVSVMQESDVVVATYGEANSNFMFLRPKTKVFEILPFGFSSTVHENLSRAYGISYELVRSQPDTEVFSACVKHFNADKGRPREVFLARWEKVAKEFTQETIRSQHNVRSNFSVSENDQSELNMLAECALYQRTSVDIRALARKVLKAATSYCNLSVNLSSIGREVDDSN